MRADADFIRDRSGRVVLLRGANYSELEFHEQGTPEPEDFAQLASWGVNVLRVPIAWSWLEPLPGLYRPEWLEVRLEPVFQAMAAHGMVAIIDMHQYHWSRCFPPGNGAPAWICDGKSYPSGFDGVVQAACDFFEGEAGPDGRSLQQHLLEAWRLVAQRYGRDPRVAGFDFLNEPHAFGCLAQDTFEADYLFPLYRRWHQVLRDEGADRIHFVEPQATRNFGFPASLEPLGENVAYAPHLYTQTGGLPELRYNGDATTIADDFVKARSEARALGGPLFVAEFGGSTEPDARAATEALLRDSLNTMDRLLLGGAVWAYFPSDNTFSLVDRSGAEKGNLAHEVSRPYPRRIAGTPTRLAFDPTTQVLSFTFVDDEAREIADPTEIFLPLERRYPSGVEVKVTEGDRYRLEPSGQLLVFRGSASSHTVTVTPR